MTLHQHDQVFYADTARVTGEVEFGPDVSLWYGAVLRGDVAKITLGQGTNVQDNAVIHCDSGKPNSIGSNVSIGHGAIIHGRSIDDGTLIGMHATVLGGTRIGKRCLIAAHALVPPNLQVPDDHVVLGVPGRVTRKTTDQEREYLAWLGPHYVQLARQYVENPQAANLRTWPPHTH